MTSCTSLEHAQEQSLMMHSVDMRVCIDNTLVGTGFHEHFSFQSLCSLLMCHCEAGMIPFFLISACSWGSTILGSKPSISATRSAVFGSILPYVMKISYTPPTEPDAQGQQ